MNWRNSYFFLFTLALALSCKEKPAAVAKESVIEGKHLIPYNSPMLTTPDPGIVIVDFRKKEAYQEAHIPGAIQLYREDFQDTTMPYSGIRLNKELTADRLGKAGITEKHRVVVYDDKGLPDASRFWWLLDLYNFDEVYLLDGGIGLWEKMGGQPTKEIPEIKPAVFHFSEAPDSPLLIEKEAVLKYVNSKVSRTVLLDARSTDEYSGRERKEGAKKAGRIPKSINIDWAEAMDYSNFMSFKPVDELEKIYAKMGASKEDTIIVYCHSGVRSAHTTFVLTQLLGYRHVMNYDGSWVEWSYDDALPFETDSITTIKK